MSPEITVDHRRLFEAASEPTIVVAPDGIFTILAMNEAWLRATGWTREAPLGRGLGELLGRHAASVLGTLERLVRTREKQTLTLPGAALDRAPRPEDGGENRDWSLLPGYVTAPDGSLASLVLRQVEVTDITKLREQHDRELHACQETWRRIVAHDLAQPIAAMEIRLDLVEDHLPPGEGRVDLEGLRRAMSKLRRLVEELPTRVIPGPGSAR